MTKRAKSQKDAMRADGFSSTKGLGKYLRAGEPTPWREIPARYGRRRYLMFLAQDHAETLRAVGFSDAAIAACAHGADLTQPRDVQGRPLVRAGRRVRFDVHHRVPLHAGGSNGIENLCLVEQSVHNPFFHKGDDPVLARMASGETREIALTVPREDVHVIAVDLNVESLVIEAEAEGGRAA